MVDTAINYRNQRSERAVGAALREQGSPGTESCSAPRAAIWLSMAGVRTTRAGTWRRTSLRPGILAVDQIVAGCTRWRRAISPTRSSRSRRNLGVECIDVYYVHNPETQLGEVPRPEFLRRLRLASRRSSARLRRGAASACYGTCTWNGYRLETDDEEYLSLAEILEAAREVAGDRHRFRALQLPFNLEMDEAATFRNQGVTRRCSRRRAPPS